MPFTPFDPNSFRAIQGLKFQQSIFDKLQEHFKDIKFDYLDKEKSKSSELLSFKVEAKLR